MMHMQHSAAANPLRSTMSPAQIHQAVTDTVPSVVDQSTGVERDLAILLTIALMVVLALVIRAIVRRNPRLNDHRAPEIGGSISQDILSRGPSDSLP